MSEEFGRLLRKYREQATAPFDGKRLTQESLAGLLEEMADLPLSPATISNWESDKHPIKSNDRQTLIGLISVLNKCNGIHSLDEAQELLFAGNYRALDSNEIGQINPNWLDDSEHSVEHLQHSEGRVIQIDGDYFSGDKYETYEGPVVQTNTGNVTIINIISLKTIKEWLATYFRWDEADEHARSSWAGMVIWSFSTFVERFAQNILLYCISILMWIATIWLIIPILQWPLDDPEARRIACVKVASGLIGIPIALALLTTPDNFELFAIESGQQKSTMFFLKWTGALVSFFVFSIFLLVVAIIWFYVALPPINVWLLRMFVLLPLFMGYVVARRIPADRYKMFEGVLKRHPADKLFFIVFFVAALLVPAAIYYWYNFLAERAVGLTILLLIIGIVLWHNRYTSGLPGYILILIVGLLIPTTIFSLFLFASERFGFTSEPTRQQYLWAALAIGYVVVPFILYLSLSLRNKLVITLRGSLGLLGVLLFLMGITELDAIIGLWGIFLTIGFWIGWGHKRFRHDLLLHPSWAVAVLVIGISFYLEERNVIPSIFNIIGFVMASTLLVYWAYQPIESESYPAN